MYKIASLNVLFSQAPSNDFRVMIKRRLLSQWICLMCEITPLMNCIKNADGVESFHGQIMMRENSYHVAQNICTFRSPQMVYSKKCIASYNCVSLNCKEKKSYRYKQKKPFSFSIRNKSKKDWKLCSRSTIMWTSSFPLMISSIL